MLATLACGSAGRDLGDVAPDAGANPNDPAPTAYTDPFAGAPAYASPSKQGGDTSHHPGESCAQKGCHGSGGEGPDFLIGGTVYQDYGGTVAAVGVEVRVMDTQGHAVSTYSQSNGNFYIRSGTSANGVVFPAVVGVRDANIARPMITQLTGTMGSCAQGGCHVGADAGGYYPIHIP